MKKYCTYVILILSRIILQFYTEIFFISFLGFFSRVSLFFLFFYFTILNKPEDAVQKSQCYFLHCSVYVCMFDGL